MLNQLHTRLDIKIKNLWKYVGTTAIGESQTPVFFFSFIVVNESAMPSKWHGNDRLLFASPARTIYIPKSTIGISNNPFDSPLFGAIVRFILMFHHQNYEFHTNSRSHPLTHTLMHVCTHARLFACAHTYTNPIHNGWEIFRSFSCKIYIYYTHSIAVSRHSIQICFVIYF